jgi:hypothetical protein
VTKKKKFYQHWHWSFFFLSFLAKSLFDQNETSVRVRLSSTIKRHLHWQFLQNRHWENACDSDGSRHEQYLLWQIKQRKSKSNQIIHVVNLPLLLISPWAEVDNTHGLILIFIAPLNLPRWVQLVLVKIALWGIFGSDDATKFACVNAPLDCSLPFWRNSNKRPTLFFLCKVFKEIEKSSRKRRKKEEKVTGIVLARRSDPFVVPFAQDRIEDLLTISLNFFCFEFTIWPNKLGRFVATNKLISRKNTLA